MTYKTGQVVEQSGELFVIGSAAPDDAERMNCDRGGDIGHTMCGVHGGTHWPRFLRLPAQIGAEQ